MDWESPNLCRAKAMAAKLGYRRCHWILALKGSLKDMRFNYKIIQSSSNQINCDRDILVNKTGILALVVLKNSPDWDVYQNGIARSWVFHKEGMWAPRNKVDSVSSKDNRVARFSGNSFGKSSRRLRRINAALWISMDC